MKNLLIEFTAIDGVRPMQATRSTFGYLVPPSLHSAVQECAQNYGLAYGEITLACAELAEAFFIFLERGGKDYVFIQSYNHQPIAIVALYWLRAAGVHHYAGDVTAWLMRDEDRDEDGDVFAVTPAEIAHNGLPPSAVQISLTL